MKKIMVLAVLMTTVIWQKPMASGAGAGYNNYKKKQIESQATDLSKAEQESMKESLRDHR